MDKLRPRYWLPVPDTFRLIVAIVLAIIIILLLLRGCNTPTPTIQLPSAGAQPLAGQPIDLSGAAAPGAVVRIFDGDTLVGETTADANGNWTLPLPAGLGAGAHDLAVRVFRDNAQIASSAPLRLSIAALPVTPVPTEPPPTPTPPRPTAPSPTPTTCPPTPPRRAPTAPPPTPTTLPPTPAGRTPTASPPTPTTLPPTPTLPLPPTASPSPTASPPPPTLPPVPTAPPPTPQAPAISSPAAGASLTADQPGDLLGSAAPGSQVQVWDGDKLLGQATADSTGKWRFELPTPLAAGTHAFQAVALDASGQELARSPALSVEVEPAQAKTGTYVVKRGDSLSKIARQFYGDAMRWPEIYAANKDKIKDPNLIYPGQELHVP